MKKQILLLIQVVYSLGQIDHHDGRSSFNIDERNPVMKSDGKDSGLEFAIMELTRSVSQINQRLSSLEANLDTKFQVLSQTMKQEQSYLIRLDSKLTSLNAATDRIYHIDSKVNKESIMIKTAIRSTTRDVQRISTRLESLEASELNISQRLKSMNKKNISDQKGNYSDVNIKNAIVTEIKNVLPRIMALELNHYYLNIASKIDDSTSKLQRGFLLRLRRIETNSKAILNEIQNGRQDVSHLTHLTRSIQNCPSISFPTESMISQFLTEIVNSSTFQNQMNKIQRNISNVIEEKMTSFRTSIDKDHSSVLWKGIFPKKSLTAIHLPGKISSNQRQCLDASTLNTLEEVKQLLKTLVTKGDDLRQTLTKQVTDGVDLLKSWHERFSVLMRRMNTDPNHNEALLAEIQELEHLTENSYSSILIAQRRFVDSCQRYQQQHSISDDNIHDVLEMLITNIDLGQQFNEKQLQEVRKLIEKMTKDYDLGDIAFVKMWLSTNKFYPIKYPQLYKDEFFTNLVRVVAKANATEGKLNIVIEQISNVEVEIKEAGRKSMEFKNIADRLLTGAKDLKGYSRTQMLSMEYLQEEVLELLELYMEFNNTLDEPGDKEEIYITPPDLLSEKCSLEHLRQILNYEYLSPERANNTNPMKSKKSPRKKGGVEIKDSSKWSTLKTFQKLNAPQFNNHHGMIEDGSVTNSYEIQHLNIDKSSTEEYKYEVTPKPSDVISDTNPKLSNNLKLKVKNGHSVVRSRVRRKRTSRKLNKIPKDFPHKMSFAKTLTGR